MKKIIDFLIIFLLVFLIIGLFKDKPEDAKIVNAGVLISTQSSSYSIPASVKLDVKNLTPEVVKFNTC